MDADRFHRISRALADPRRMEILARIASEAEVACATLADESTVSQPTISHHLKELSSAGRRSSASIASTGASGRNSIGQPTDIASVALFLASDESGWITGQVIPVAGGLR